MYDINSLADFLLNRHAYNIT